MKGNQIILQYKDSMGANSGKTINVDDIYQGEAHHLSVTYDADKKSKSQHKSLVNKFKNLFL